MVDYQETPKPEISPIWQEPDLQDLREFRELKDEDLKIVEGLLDLPKAIAIEHHNFFSFSQDNALKDLEKEAGRLKVESSSNDDELKKRMENRLEYTNLFQELIKKYDWQTAWGVNVVLERRKQKEKN
jgi:hypothetical protein